MGTQVLKQRQPHHRTIEDFVSAAQNGCYICRTITNSPAWRLVEAGGRYPEAAWQLAPLAASPPCWLRLTIDLFGDESEGDAELSDGETSIASSLLEFLASLTALRLYPGWGFT